MNQLERDCHPEPRRRRGTSQALIRFRESGRMSVSGRVIFGGSPYWQLRVPSARCASLGMTCNESEM